MINELDNPFSVTKATEFSDEEIYEYWVNFNPEENVSIETILNPTEYLPKYVIGGKGCGKTHILRYFSFQLQKIRHNFIIKDILKNDKYIGVYSILSGLNSSRFSGKGINESEWSSVFEYYFELNISDNLLHTLKEILLSLDIGSNIETILIQNILLKFSNFKEIKNIFTLNDLIEYLSDLRRKIDYQVLNAAFTRQLNFEEIKVLFSPGDLIFGIPNIVLNSIEALKNIIFIYILDEYEKLFEWQKEFLNTIVWDKKMPVTFWIGARKYGYTTRKTKSGQEMKEGSEFQNVSLDDIIRKNEDLYKKFAEKLYTNRLLKFYEVKGLFIKPEDASQKFRERFEIYDESKIINEIISINSKREYPHLRELRANIKKGIKLKRSLDIRDETQINEIINAIITDTENNPLEQKYKLFLLYKKWHKAKNNLTFESILNNINLEYKNYKSGKKSDFNDIKDKRKKDFIAQLAKENKIKNTEYSGIDTFIELSQGNARSFILILKKVIEYSKIKGEKPLENGSKISLDSQYLAVYDTAKWFYEDAELIGESGKRVYNSLKNLADYFIQERFCDKPVDTTVSCFYIKEEELSINSLNCLEIMKLHSLLIEIDKGRFEKNSGRKERMFQINKTLAPYWNLPTVIRGSIFLNKDIAEAIFNYDSKDKFEDIYKLRKSQLNAPDFVKYSDSETSQTIIEI